mgnify:CR=1 FL=1
MEPVYLEYSTFHYASTLSHISWLLLLSCLLYIPLCFYFIQSSTFKRSIHDITLHSIMLLLYQERQTERGKKNHSTFHYASTLSLPFSVERIGKSFSTFHYASTLSKMSIRKPPAISDLYIPLCFYFISWSTRLSRYRLRLYIPLCFYFI